ALTRIGLHGLYGLVVRVLHLNCKLGNFIDLSKGTKTKLGLAVCLSMNGDLVILDEITSGIDPLTRIEILNEIKAYQNQTGASIILVTHILDDVIQLCNRFVVLTNGSITTDFSLTPETDEAVLKSLLVAKKWGILNDRLSY
ncbi:AAA family ATPase, partial [Lacticaseibacillus rhamnosus]|uniref:AAA family ATPase n=3 Tax=Lacticaseibacillus rhamnosus TaxID=47715 RepID=UPI001E3DE9B2